MRRVIGIDPGHKGGIVVMDENGNLEKAMPMPCFGNEFNYKKIDEIIALEKTKNSIIAIELVGFMGMETAKNISDLVYHAGVIYGIAIAHGVPMFTAQPSIWKKKIGLPPIGITYAKKGETAEEKRKRVNENSRKRRAAKNVSIQYAIRMFPKLPDLVDKMTDGIAEACLIGEYVRRQQYPERVEPNEKS